jgi:hypothetical protein
MEGVTEGGEGEGEVVKLAPKVDDTSSTTKCSQDSGIPTKKISVPMLSLHVLRQETNPVPKKFTASADTGSAGRPRSTTTSAGKKQPQKTKNNSPEKPAIISEFNPKEDLKILVQIPVPHVEQRVPVVNIKIAK